MSDGAINAWVFGVVTVLVALWAWSGRQAVRRGNGAVATSHRPVHVSRGCAVPRRAARLALVVLVPWPWRRRARPSYSGRLGRTTTRRPPQCGQRVDPGAVAEAPLRK